MKKSLDEELNFDDLGTTHKKVEKPKDEISGYQKNKGRVVAAGIVLGIPEDDRWYPVSYQTKDIMHVNADEFIKWAKMVYPISLEPYKEHFEDPRKRLRQFHKIVAFHKFSMFQVGKHNIGDSLN